ncbi:hypothetical protein RXV86_03415 [Alisedimentitalea sp. MJ-SS2]|uniref:hypothetical protein n=1 Tax=Aliisedimentitalea sp. MJ-SS2 TaxID=3049795 RepID=UPI00290E3751|nr:hypothetical protein [Alisedimentitalea sp. MJ-SS2]MDU8926426.1 hypothetical protein [Alisedimentitalea sp. MJ-SS2]
MSQEEFSGLNREEQLKHVQSASVDERNEIMRAYDWEQYPEAVLGWISAQKGITLNTALLAFFKGDPWRFNYLPKRDVGAEFRSTASLLDSICQRINAGFYLPGADQPCEIGLRKLDKWVENQRRDQRTHRRGRWVIEAEVLDPILTCKRRAMENELRREAEAEVAEATPAAPIESRSRGFSLKKLAGALTG